jgi:hypothetical protein
MAEDKPAKKKPVNGRAKGAGFEGKLVKLFAEKFAPLQFRRSQSSGAIVGGQNEVNLSLFSEEAKILFVGDVVPSNEADIIKAEGWRLRFTLEAKFYKEPDSFQSLFANSTIFSWFDQALTDSKKVKDREALLIFKWNHTPIFAAFETHIDPPGNMLPMMELNYNWKLLNGDIEQRKLRIVPLDMLLEHPDWWKVRL